MPRRRTGLPTFWFSNRTCCSSKLSRSSSCRDGPLCLICRRPRLRLKLNQDQPSLETSYGIQPATNQGDVNELPADAVVTIDHAGSPSGDAMADRADSTELFDIEMDQFAWVLALVAANGFRFQGTQLVQTQTTQNTADGGRRDASLGGDLLARPALATQPLDLLDNHQRRWPVQPMRPGGAILQPCQSVAAISLKPLANRPRADAYGLADGLRLCPLATSSTIHSRPRGVSRAFLCMFIRSFSRLLRLRHRQLLPARTGWTTC